jgi:hypothetical protein
MIFCFVFIFVFVFVKTMLIKLHLLTSTKRQTHARSLSMSKCTSIVGLDLRRAARVGQVALVVHYVTIGNVVLGTGCASTRLPILDAARYCNVGARDGSSSTKREIQRHFYNITKYIILSIFIFKI